MLEQTVYGAPVVGLMPNSDNLFAGVRLRNGEYHYLNFIDMSDWNMSGTDTFKALPNNLCDSKTGDGFMASFNYNFTDIVIHTTAVGSKAERLMATDSYIAELLVKSDESAVLLRASDTLTAVNPIKNEILRSVKTESPVIAAAYLGKAQDEVAAALSDGILRMDTATEERRLDALDLSELKFSGDDA